MGSERWNRLLWGVEFTDSVSGEAPMLIGALWANSGQRECYAGEPTRALLFCTRREARTWCQQRMQRWRETSVPGDVVKAWKVRAVRVRETVARVGDVNGLGNVGPNDGHERP